MSYKINAGEEPGRDAVVRSTALFVGKSQLEIPRFEACSNSATF